MVFDSFQSRLLAISENIVSEVLYEYSMKRSDSWFGFKTKQVGPSRSFPIHMPLFPIPNIISWSQSSMKTMKHNSLTNNELIENPSGTSLILHPLSLYCSVSLLPQQTSSTSNYLPRLFRYLLSTPNTGSFPLFRTERSTWGSPSPLAERRVGGAESGPISLAPGPHTHPFSR